MRTMTRTFLLSLCALLAVVASASAQTLYTITDLGTLSGPQACTPFALNELGEVVGSCTGLASFNETAFVWKNGVIKTLGKLPKGHDASAFAINGQGAIVGSGDTGDFRPDPILWRNGRVINIDASSGNAHALAINEAGVIVGNFSKGFGNASSWNAVIWTERAKQPGRFDKVFLPSYPGGDAKARYGYATAANEGLQVVGWVQNTLFGQYGAFWDNDASHTLALLKPYPGDWSSLALGVNDLGQAVGESHPPYRTRAVLWQNDADHTPVDLGVLPGDTDSVARYINTRGQVVGSSFTGTVQRPFLWENGTMFDLNSLLDASGAGWTLGYATGLNDAGQIIGTGTLNGEVRAFLLRPVE